MIFYDPMFLKVLKISIYYDLEYFGIYAIAACWSFAMPFIMNLNTQISISNVPASSVSELTISLSNNVILLKKTPI